MCIRDSATTFAHLDATTGLSRKIVEQGIYQAAVSYTHLPMNILAIAIRPTSLCMRLCGNVLGAFVIMELIKDVYKRQPGGSRRWGG